MNTQRQTELAADAIQTTGGERLPRRAALGLLGGGALALLLGQTALEPAAARGKKKRPGPGKRRRPAQRKPKGRRQRTAPAQPTPPALPTGLTPPALATPETVPTGTPSAATATPLPRPGQVTAQAVQFYTLYDHHYRSWYYLHSSFRVHSQYSNGHLCYGYFWVAGYGWVGAWFFLFKDSTLWIY